MIGFKVLDTVVLDTVLSPLFVLHECIHACIQMSTHDTHTRTRLLSNQHGARGETIRDLQ